MAKPAVSQNSAGTPNRLDVTGYLAVLIATACWGTSEIFVEQVIINAGRPDAGTAPTHYCSGN